MSPCTVSMPGKICKEYWYTPDDFLGSVEYFYNQKGELLREDRFSSDHNSRQIQYQYSGKGLIINRSEYDEDKKLRDFREYYYNEFDSLSVQSTHIDGTLYAISVIDYNDEKKRIQKKTETADGTTQYIEYLYDNGKLFRETHLNIFKQVDFYILYNEFSNNVTRLRYFNSGNILTLTEIIIRDNQGRPLEKKSYRNGSHLFQREFWSYDQDLLMKYARNNGDNFPLDYILYQY